MRFFQVYQYAAPLVVVPLSYWLWLRRYDGHHAMALLAMSIPIVFAYVVPAIGTNVLRLWEFNTRLRIGRFRPHHGFVFGGATSLFGLACLPYPAANWDLGEFLRAALVLGSTLACWNWLYDIFAIKTGFLCVYNRPWHERRGAEAIATAYAPVLFGVFGACYGVSLRAFEYWLVYCGRDELFWSLALTSHAVALSAPVAAFAAWSMALHGETGLRSYEELPHEQ
jgi:hypothetical protein